ncbi:hypothetical protein [Ascidiaceihabitans donghaensis]|uniref:hypothetical protein n=1 Tax=Ascidiaceihabitans donghaensis TaxID=1510460 RepID=UPI000D55B8E9|nr:hypothetical protein [Ascidiaceihabitans donghaensis]
MAVQKWIIAGATALALGACGDTISEQALAGGAIGAGAAVVTSGSVATGAVVGAAGNIVYCELNPGKC